MHHPSNSPRSSTTIRCTLISLILICVVLFASFMWCYSRRVVEIHQEQKQQQIIQQQQEQRESASSSFVKSNNKIKNNVAYSPPQQKQQQQKLVSSSSSPALTKLRYRIVVFTYLRPSGLKRILSSLANAYYPREAKISLAILLDYPKEKKHLKNNDDMQSRTETLEIVKNFKWNHGDLTIHRRQVNVGLKRNILESWYPPTSSQEGQEEACALFEDDIEVSPYWFEWVLSAVDKYYFLNNNNNNNDENEKEEEKEKQQQHRNKILGISLYRPIHDELSRKKCEIDTNHQPFLLQQPCSWGALYFPKPWRQFRDFYDEFDATGQEPIVITSRGEEPDSNTWPRTSSWKKYLIRFMHEQGWSMVYPNLPNRYVFSTNHLMKGEHNLPPRHLFELPLLDENGVVSSSSSSSSTIINSERFSSWKEKLVAVDDVAATKNENDSEEENSKKNILMIAPPKFRLFDEESLSELENLQCYDVMFHKVDGGVSDLLKPQVNRAGGHRVGGGGGEQHHHRHHHQHHSKN